jgi:hypothetical protein
MNAALYSFAGFFLGWALVGLGKHLYYGHKQRREDGQKLLRPSPDYDPKQYRK